MSWSRMGVRRGVALFEVLRQQRLITPARALQDGFREHGVAEQVFATEQFTSEIIRKGFLGVHVGKQWGKT